MLIFKDFLMRIQHWIAPILGLALLLASGQIATAQYGQPGQYSNPNATWPPGTAPISPQQGGNAYGQAAPFQQAAYPAPQSPGFAPVPIYGGTRSAFTGEISPFSNVSANPIGQSPHAPSMLPWPNITPYENEFQQHYVEGGLWKRLTQNGGKRYHFGIEYISTRTEKQKGIVGDSRAARYIDQVGELLEDIDEEIRPAFENQQNIGVTLLSEFGAFEISAFDPTREGSFNYYNRLDLQEMADIFGPGIRARWGYWNQDDSGFEIEGWWAKDSADIHDSVKEDSTSFLLGRTRDRRQFPDGQSGFAPGIADLTSPELAQFLGPERAANFIPEVDLKNLRGLPVNDGSPSGVTIPYDLGFQVENRSRSAGGSADFFWSPIIRKKLFKVRPLAGARYLHINESFNFTGLDSGLLYGGGEEGDDVAFIHRDVKLHSVPNQFDDNGDFIVDNAGSFEGGGDDGGGGDGDPLFTLAANRPTLSFVDMQTETHLIGPEIGIRFDLGGDKFKLWGQSKFGLLAAREEQDIRGDNIGMITRTLNTPIIANDPLVDEGGLTDTYEQTQPLIDATPQNPTPNAFSDSDDHTHISPMLEQSIFADMNLLSVVPFVNRIKLFEEAQFRFGWTVIYVANVATTNESIVWDGNPSLGLFPNIKTKRRSWVTSNYSFGVFWDY